MKTNIFIGKPVVCACITSPRGSWAQEFKTSLDNIARTPPISNKQKLTKSLLKLLEELLKKEKLIGYTTHALRLQFDFVLYSLY
jgi:hypothetical protein